MLCDAYRAGRKVLICGNGGSASDADHWAGELLKGFRKQRPLSPEERRLLPGELGKLLQAALPAIPITSFTAASTAFSNDVDPELAFAQLVWGLGQSGDVFIGISTSGNARNVCLAAQAANAKGMFTIGLTGKDGGVLRTAVKLAISVPASETYRIQEYHLPVYHCLSSMLEDEFFTT